MEEVGWLGWISQGRCPRTFGPSGPTGEIALAGLIPATHPRRACPEEITRTKWRAPGIVRNSRTSYCARRPQIKARLARGGTPAIVICPRRNTAPRRVTTSRSLTAPTSWTPGLRRTHSKGRPDGRRHLTKPSTAHVARVPAPPTERFRLFAIHPSPPTPLKPCPRRPRNRLQGSDKARR